MCVPNPFRDSRLMTFPHHHNAHNSDTLLLIRRTAGMTGVGIYWCLMEILHSRGGKIAKSDVGAISYLLQVKEADILEILPFFCRADMFCFYCDAVIAELGKRENRNAYQREFMRAKRKPEKKLLEPKEPKEPKPSFVPPTIQEVRDYFAQKGYSNADKAYEYYAVAGWRDSKNNPVKNWKQKMFVNWMTEENKIEQTTTKLHAGGNMPTGFAL
jgi:hypothetical protein